MIINITEEEREFVERLCSKAEVIASVGPGNSYYKDRHKIRSLKIKLKSIDHNLIKEPFKNDH